jgi:hypothetical protein
MPSLHVYVISCLHFELFFCSFPILRISSITKHDNLCASLMIDQYIFIVPNYLSSRWNHGWLQLKRLIYYWFWVDRSFIESRVLEPYLLKLSQVNFIWLCKLRTCNMKIPIETGRWVNIPQDTGSSDNWGQ